MQSCVSYWGLT